MAYDLFHLPQPPYTQVYNSRGTYTWNKPQGITMVSFFVVGGGGGGGRGGNGGVTVGVNGAGGGGGGAVTKLIIPAIFIPESLFINVGAGGGASTAGEASFIGVAGGTNVFTTRLVFSAGGTQGGDGSVAVGGTAGPGGAASTTASAIYHNLGIFTSIAGGSGGGGTGTGIGGSPLTTNLTSGGSGGAGRNSAIGLGTPGTITGNGTILPTLSPGNRAVTLDGQSGVYSLAPFQSYGGIGAYGAVRTAGLIGGRGGNGVYGSGGGGGGSSTSAASGGAGGTGGDGFVIITCF
jgi:hypothetical protein